MSTETKTKGKRDWLAQYRSLSPRPDESPREFPRNLFELRHSASYRLWLPLAPTSNNTKIIRAVWRTKKIWLADSAAAEAYRIVVAELWDALWPDGKPLPLTGRLRVRYVVHFPRLGCDVENRSKAMCDALTACGAWGDDKQIDGIHGVRGSLLPPFGAMDVEVFALS